MNYRKLSRVVDTTTFQENWNRGDELYENYIKPLAAGKWTDTISATVSTFGEFKNLVKEMKKNLNQYVCRVSYKSLYYVIDLGEEFYKESGVTESSVKAFIARQFPSRPGGHWNYKFDYHPNRIWLSALMFLMNGCSPDNLRIEDSTHK